MEKIRLKVYRGDSVKGELKEYQLEIDEGMVVLDAIHKIQATQAPDLACRWNCKADRCGSCRAEVNGFPRLMCMTRIDKLPKKNPITVEPMKSFPIIKDLVTDVYWNYEVNKKILPFTPKPPEPDGTWRMQQIDIDRVQEFRKCIECFLCQDVCQEKIALTDNAIIPLKERVVDRYYDPLAWLFRKVRRILKPSSK